MHLLKEILNVLKPMKVGVDAFFRRDANSLSAHTTFLFIAIKLEQQNTGLAQWL